MNISWDELLLAFLHDPPDKALSISGHVSRARDNAKAVLGDDQVSRKRIEECVTDADPLAAMVERLPMPKAGEQGQHAVGPEENRLLIVHPLSGSKREISVPALGNIVQKEYQCLCDIKKDLSQSQESDGRSCFLAVWRLWPDALIGNVDPCFAQLPADTRTPDHTIWNHLDITTAFKAVESEGGAALLAFALGPVQRFIEASRSVRDLWSGSMILSWLAFQAMLPVIQQLGPTALVYPALRGNPLLDLWLRTTAGLGDKIPRPEEAQCLTPSLPHRFLAIVPWGDNGTRARELATACKAAFAKAWNQMAEKVRQTVTSFLNGAFPDWDRRWDFQIKNYFSVFTAIVPLSGSGEEVDRRLAYLLAGKTSFAEAFPEAEAVREMARAIPETDQHDYPQDHAGRWQYQVELVHRALAAKRSIRHVPMSPPPPDPPGRYPQKCSLLGTFEQMGPDDLLASAQFWRKLAGSPEDQEKGLNIEGVRIRKGEALCAVAMVKRFAGPAFLAENLSVSSDRLRFPDTWTVAAAEWLHEAGIDWRADWKYSDGKSAHWNGHWLHWSRRDENLQDAGPCPEELWNRIQQARQEFRKHKRDETPPVYYTILKLDGDDLGLWLRGEKSPRVCDVMHPKLVTYYESLGEKARQGLKVRRPVGPALHAAISTALTNFALYAVPRIVTSYHGTVVYSGGDDTLVLLPLSTALTCALELQRVYTSDWWSPDDTPWHKYLMMGSRATVSGGLVIVHATDDLRLALQNVRYAEEQAKRHGKNALMIVLRRRSGEQTSALCPWDLVETVNHWRMQFARGASDRWAYHLDEEWPVLGGLPAEAIEAEIRRQISRAESPTPQLLPPDDLVGAFNRLRADQVNIRGTPRNRFFSSSEALRTFLTLCHTASFMARGRDYE